MKVKPKDTPVVEEEDIKLDVESKTEEQPTVEEEGEKSIEDKDKTADENNTPNEGEDTSSDDKEGEQLPVSDDKKEDEEE